MSGLGFSAAGARLTIDLAALARNYRLLAERAAPARAAAVIKADGYGLGAVPVARTLAAAGCSDFFVATLEEAVTVAGVVGVHSDTYVLNGLHAGSEAACAEARIVPVLNTLGQARRWQALAQSRGERMPAALQVDSGMSRLGLSPVEVAELAADAAFFEAVPLRLLMSHLACADEPDHPANARQASAFAAMADLLPPAPRSLANSGGIFLGGAFHNDLVRAGIALYGGEPSMAGFRPMSPVVSLKAKVVQVRQVEAGQGVGYGLTFQADGPRTLATIGVGYADGWPWALGNVGAVYFAGRRLPIAGRVSMDSFTVDATALGRIGLCLNEGDEVELLGEHQTLEAVAEQAGTIAYEILTSLGRRYHRTYQGMDMLFDVDDARRAVETVG